MKSFTKYIENIDVVVLFEKSRKAKRIILSIKKTGEVRVAVPYLASFSKAEEFVESRTYWISEAKRKIKKMQDKNKEIVKDSLAGKEAYLGATERLRNRLKEIADEYGFSYGRVTVRNQKTRWGSCSYHNNINLNIQLARLPEKFIDYVILHELIHTKIKNHSRSFWEEMEKFMPDARARNHEIKKFEFITPFTN